MPLNLFLAEETTDPGPCTTLPDRPNPCMKTLVGHQDIRDYMAASTHDADFSEPNRGVSATRTSSICNGTSEAHHLMSSSDRRRTYCKTPSIVFEGACHRSEAGRTIDDMRF